jgi:hypothetical protein
LKLSATLSSCGDSVAEEAAADLKLFLKFQFFEEE